VEESKGMPVTYLEVFSVGYNRGHGQQRRGCCRYLIVPQG